LCLNLCTCIWGYYGFNWTNLTLYTCGQYCISLGSCLIATCCQVNTYDTHGVQSVTTYCLFSTFSQCINLDSCYDYQCFCTCSWIYYYIANYTSGVNDVETATYSAILANTYLIQCYCIIPDNGTCEYERLYSIKDYSESQTVLDPNGVLNYLAIAYS